jgi:uncharacterized protein YutE (UPF0331/DUF86 family)
VSPGALDAPVVERHLAELDAALVALRAHRGRPVEALGVADERWAVERGLQLCAQNALDAATHICASLGRDAPDYASSIDELAALGILPRDFAARFRGIAGFRNILVHGYLAVDLARLHEFLNEKLDDFVEFASHVHAWLVRSSGA